MHSSRMRTGRSLTVCCSVLPGGGLPGPGGGSPWSQGGSAWSRGGVCLVLGGFSLVWGGSAWSWGGFSLVPGGGLPGPGGFLETPPVNRITDTCKNITLATTSLQPVTRLHSSRMHAASLLPVSPSMHCAGGPASDPGGCLPLVLGGCLLPGGSWSRGWGCIPACNGADPPVNRITDMCKT